MLTVLRRNKPNRSTFEKAVSHKVKVTDNYIPKEGRIVYVKLTTLLEKWLPHPDLFKIVLIMATKQFYILVLIIPQERETSSYDLYLFKSTDDGFYALL